VLGCQDQAQPHGGTDTDLPETGQPDTEQPDITPSIFTTGVCLEGWCFEQPLPFGPRLPWPTGFWSASPDEAWAVLDKTLVHWKDRRWTVVGGEAGSADPTTRFAVPLDGTDRNNVVVATTDGAMHFDGTHWTGMVDCPRPASVWVAGPGDVWIASVAPEYGDIRDTTLHRWDGSSCTAFQTFEYAEDAMLAGSDPTHGWLALRFRRQPPPSDVEGQLLRWDGSVWSPALDVDPISALTAVTPDLAWLSAYDAFWKWDGAGWAETGLENVGDFWFASETDGWATTGYGAAGARTGSVLRWDGTTWTTVRTAPDYPVHLYAAGPDEVLVTMDGGRGAHWNGVTWTPTLPDTESLDLVDVAVGPTGEAWAVSEGALLRRSAGGWQMVDTQGGTSLWSGVAGEVWVVGAVGLRRWANGWNSEALPPDVDDDVISVWGLAPDTLFVATATTLSKRTREGWSWSRPAPSGIGALRAIHGSGPDDVWVVGSSGLARVAGEGWEVVDMPTCDTSHYGPFIGQLDALWVEAPGHPVAVGYGSYDGGDVVYDAVSVVRRGEEGWSCDLVREGRRSGQVAACDGEVWIVADDQLGRVLQGGWRWDTKWLGGSPAAITCVPGAGFWVAGRGGMIAHRPPPAP
jgi:hypothetical protein